MLRAIDRRPRRNRVRAPNTSCSSALTGARRATGDVGLHRHWLDPTVPFAVTLAAPAHGLLVTSATLRDSGEAETEIAWSAAEAASRRPHLPSPAIRAAVAWPFDYAARPAHSS